MQAFAQDGQRLGIEDVFFLVPFVLSRFPDPFWIFSPLPPFSRLSLDSQLEQLPS